MNVIILLKVILSFGIIVSGVYIGKNLIASAIEETKNYRKEVESRLIEKAYEKLYEIPSVDCSEFSGTPAEVFSYLSSVYGVPKEIALLVIGVETGGRLNLYATSCDVCKSCGGVTSDRWKENRKVQEWKNWVLQNRNILEPYMSKGSKVIDCSKPPECWCNVGFGVMQIASFNLKNFPPSESPKPYAPEEEPPDSPYNLCTNLSYGFEVLGRCWKKYQDKAKAICCYNGVNNSQYLEKIKNLAEKLGVKRSWKAKIVDFFQINVEKIKEWWNRLRGERC